MKELIKLFPSHLQPFIQSWVGDFGLHWKCIVEMVVSLFTSFGLLSLVDAAVPAPSYDLTYDIWKSVISVVSGLILAFGSGFVIKVFLPYYVGKFKNKYPKWSKYEDKKE